MCMVFSVRVFFSHNQKAFSCVVVYGVKFVVEDCCGL